MSYLNCNIPPIECYVRNEYLRNMESGHGGFESCLLFAFSSIPGRVPLFHCMLEDGGVFYRLPISAFMHRKNAPLFNSPQETLEELVLWDSFSYYPSVITYDVLQNKKMKYTSRRNNKYFGQYMFTIDWAHPDRNCPITNFSETPGQDKCGHFIKLDNGYFAIQPNNRVKFHEPSFCTKPNALIARKIHTQIWTVEGNWKWIFEDSENYDYTIQERK